MGNAPSTSGQDSSPSHVPGDDSKVANIIREPRPEHLRIPDTDSEEEVDDRQSIEMEVPHPQFSYNGAQRCGAVTSDAMMSDAAMSDRLARTDIATTGVAREMSRNPVEVNMVMNSHNESRDETMCKEVTSSECEKDLANSQQQFDPFRIKENNSRQSRQSDSETSELGRRRMPELGRQGISGQRRLLEDLRAEFNEELRTQQVMFLDAIAQSEARQAETLANAWAVFENLIANMRTQSDASSANENSTSEIARIWRSS